MKSWNTAIVAVLGIVVLALAYITFSPRQAAIQVAAAPPLSTVVVVTSVAYPPPSTPAQSPRPVRTIPPTNIPPSTYTPMPTDTPLPPHPPADAADAAAIKAVVERAYELRGIAARTFDISQFDTVYVNDPSTPLSEGQLSFIREVLPHVQARIGNLDATPGALDFWRVRFLHWQLGAERLEQRQQGTPVSPQEAPLGPPRRTDPMHKPYLRINDIKVEGDRAEVVLDDGAWIMRLFLVRTREGWRIAGERELKLVF